jgi:hypothetical protein
MRRLPRLLRSASAGTALASIAAAIAAHALQRLGAAEWAGVIAYAALVTAILGSVIEERTK